MRTDGDDATGTGDRTPPGKGRMLARGVVKHCPNCGSGRLFSRWFRMGERCPRCGYKFEREEGFFLGAFVINFALTETVLGIFIAVSIILTLPDPPIPLLAVIGVAVMCVVPIVFYPFSKTIWAAVDLGMRPLEAPELAEAHLARTVRSKERSG